MKNRWALKPIVTIKKGELLQIHTIQVKLNYKVIFWKTKKFS